MILILILIQMTNLNDNDMCSVEKELMKELKMVDDQSTYGRIERFLFQLVRKFGFWGILVCASVRIYAPAL